MSIRQNTFYNLMGSIVPLAVSLVTIPVYIGLIGSERYGVLAIVWLLLGYFGLFDLGLGSATAQQIGALRDASGRERAQIFWTALTMNAALGIVGGLVVWPVALFFFGNVFQIDEAMRPEVMSAIPWLVLAVPMAVLSGTLSGALQGRERFLELNIISVAGTVLFQLLPLVVAKFLGTDLGLLLPAVLFSRMLTLVAIAERCKRHVILKYKPSFNREKALKLLRFGGWVTVTAFVGPMMVILDRFIIGALINAKSVTYYTIPFQLAERTTLIPAAMTTALFPRFSAAAPDEEKKLAEEALSILIVVMTPVIAVCILCIKPFLAWWVGAEIAEEAAIVGLVLLLGFWVNGFARVPFSQLQARGKPGLVAKCHLFELLPYLLLLYIGLNYLGIVGAAVAFSIRALIDFLLLAGLAGSLTLALRLLVTPAILLSVSMLIALENSFGQLIWIVYVTAYLLITLGWAWWKAPDSIRKNIRAKIALIP